MSFSISAGVYIKETDLSNIVPNVSTTTAALAGYSTKGDITQRILVTNTQQFINEYGEPVPGSYFHYTALAFLENGNRLYCMRAVNGALYGGVEIKKTTSGESNAALATGLSTPDFVDDSDSDNLFMVFGKDPGTWNANVGVQITNIDNAEYTFDIEVYVKDADGNFQLTETFEVSRISKLDGYGRQMYLEDKINGYSNYIKVSDGTADSDVLPKAQATTLALGGGSNGSTTTASHINTAWDFFANPDDVDIRLLLNGGETSVTVQTKLKEIAEARKDCVAILDMPYSELTSIASQVTWRETTQNFNSSYCALYSPWVNWYDQYNDKLVELPPSGFVGSQIAYNDYNGQPWFAPAGLNRGIVQSALGATDVFTEGERDSLYETQINPIQVFRGDGVVIWGQKMEATKPSALDRLNVRRLLIILEKSLAASLRYFVFEPNSDLTRFRITGMCEEYMDYLYAKGAFQSSGEDKGYKVVCDTTNNTPAVIDRNECIVDVYVKPIRMAEYIKLNVIVTATGTDFTELLAKGISF